MHLMESALLSDCSLTMIMLQLGLYVVFFILESAYLALAVKQKRGSSLDSAWQEGLKTDTVPYKHDIATTP